MTPNRTHSPDHLGSSSWITYTDGSAVQHLHYLPWGEDFVDQRTTNWAARYTFSAKEKDTETGLSYFGARYYNSDLSIWLSVDPMSDKYPSLSPYVYCANNPIKLVDPNGEEIDWVEKADGTIYWDENATSKETTKHGETYLGKEGQHTIGTDVWNYHSDGTCDELRPIIVGTDDNSLIPSNNNTKKSNIDNANNILSNIELVTSLPIAAAAESVVKTSAKIALKSFGGVISAVGVVPDIFNYVNNPTIENRNKLIVSGTGFVISLIPGIGPVGSVIWNSIDMDGGFDKFYKK